jgi:hypothetical protein
VLVKHPAKPRLVCNCVIVTRTVRLKNLSYNLLHTRITHSHYPIHSSPTSHRSQPRINLVICSSHTMRTACSAAHLQQQESSGGSSQGHGGCDNLSGCALGGLRSGCGSAGRGGGSWGCTGLGGVGTCGCVLGGALQDILWDYMEVDRMQQKRLSG